jgi:acyl transferase domain-containing protein/enoyl-CoA hydratase/carnithine racemase/acyl carrier protein
MRRTPVDAQMTAHTPTQLDALPFTTGVAVENSVDGIRTLRFVPAAVANQPQNDVSIDANDAFAQLRDALQAAAIDETTKVVRLLGLEAIPHATVRAAVNRAFESGLTAALAACPLPIIAELSSDANGAALLLAALCDLIVCAESSRHGAALGGFVPTAAEHALFEARFGAVVADVLLTAPQASTAIALRAMGWGCAVVPADELSAHTQGLAARLAEKSRDVLRLLKPHLAQQIAAVAALPSAEDRLVATSASDEAAAALPKAPVPHIALRDHDDGIVQLTLRRGGKKYGVQAMTQALQAVFALDALKVGRRAIVLVSEYPGFLPDAERADAAAVLALLSTLQHAPLPVVAVAGTALDGTPFDGRAWLALQACDAIVYQADGRYDAAQLAASPAIAAVAAPWFERRLGRETTRTLLLAGECLDGKDLQAQSLALPVATRAQSIDAAIMRARGWAHWPQPAIRAWKAARMAAMEVTPAVSMVDAEGGDVVDGVDDVRQTFASAAPTLQTQSIAFESAAVTLVEHSDGIVEVTMHDRASKNMLTPALVEGLADAFSRVASSAACKVVVLTGYDTFFCSGGTMDALRAIHEGRIAFTDDRTFRLPLDCHVPVIAAMQGHAIGAGLSLGLFCDIALFGAESRYRSPYLRYGFTPGVGATLSVPARFGHDLGRETMLTADEYEGAALQARGVSLTVLERRAVRDAAMTLAARIAMRPKSWLTQAKSELARPLRERLETICAQEVQMHAATFVGRDDTLETIESSFGRTEQDAARLAAAARPQNAEIALSSVRGQLKHLLAQELHLEDDEIDHNAQYTDLGLDSITGVTWIRKVNAHYGLSLDATIVYAHPTLSKLAQHVKSLIESREPEQATPDFAELQTQKLRSFGDSALAQRNSNIKTREAMPAIALTAIDDTVDAVESATQNGSTVSLISIRETLAELLARELHLERNEIDLDTQFNDLGLDSITGVTWIRKVNETYGLSLDATIVYTYPTLNRLAQHVKTLVSSRDLQHATPDFAELQAQKLRTVGAATPEAHNGRINLAEPDHAVAPSQLPGHAQPRTLAPIDSARDIAIRAPTSLPATSARQLRSWRQSLITQPKPAPAAPTTRATPEDIAIIGMAGRFPMAADIESFWRNLCDGIDAIREVSPERWDINAVFQPGEPCEGRTYSKWLGQLDDHDRFDPLFFGISPAEARAMDPQQRVFLETCWHSIEHAGYDPKSLGGSRCGVFVGAAANDYSQLSRRSQLSAYGFTGNACSILAARIAYVLDLQGPCITIDTACSASLVAIASACDSLSTGSSDVALAGGVYVGAGPSMHIMTSQSGMLSPDGRCYSFDHRANGFVPGEAVGVLLLKRLSDAERDGDIIHAVVRGWGVNQDGRTNGITAPNPASQTRLMQEVYRRHRLDPAEIQLIEAHGTGTPLGDPIEVRGLIDAFAGTVGPTPHCALGSVKSNIGHCLTAAGVSAAIKAVLALAHRQLPPTIHYERLNPHIRLDGSPFYVNTALQDWALQTGKRRHAAVSSFGYSGTNAHIVFGEYIGAHVSRALSLPRQVIVPLSARTPERLTEAVRSLLGFIRRDGETLALADLAYTLQVGRTAFEVRLGFVVDSVTQLTERLQAYLDGARDLPDSSAGHAHKNREALGMIDDDEEFRDALLERWIAQKKYSQLLKLWAKGMELDWRRLYPSGTPQRIVLPTYPFARERYWIDATDATGLPVAMSPSTIAPDAPSLEEPSPEYLYFEEEWVEKEVSVEAGEGRDTAHATTDRSFESNSFEHVVLLSDANSNVALPGATRVEDVSALAAAIDALHTRLNRPVSVVCDAARGRGRDGVHLLFALFRRLRGREREIGRVLLVGCEKHTQTEGAWDRSWIGFERSLRTAMPELKLALRYIEDNEAFKRCVLDGLDNGGIAAYRGAHRFEPMLRKVAAPERPTTMPFKQHGHYLITGGCGALGARFAQHLASTCQARLTLIGRRAVTAEIERQLQALREAGAQAVEYVALDLADADAVATWAQSLPNTISGVIHAAGVSQPQPFHEKDAAGIDAVLGPKTWATLALDQALRTQPLDLVCYFSSSSAILGDGGACDYAIANRFLMEYGRDRATAGLPGTVLTILWPLWEQVAGVGMGLQDLAQTALYLRSSGQSALGVEAGLGIWDALVAEVRAQTLVMHGQPARIGQILDRMYGHVTPPSPLLTTPVVTALPMAISTSLPALDPHVWRARLREDVRAIVAQTLELAPERLDDETNLADYGFDSIGLTTLAKRLQTGLDVEVTPALFFNRANVQGLIEHFAQKHTAHFERRYAMTLADVAPLQTAAAISAQSATRTSPQSSTQTQISARLPAVLPALPAGIQAPVAIVGMSGRFPKAADTDALWSLLAEARSGIDEVPASRWDWRDYFVAPGHRGNRIHARAGGFVDGVDAFDPLFFEVSPAEAEEMDPAERLLMMEAYRAFEDAGIAPTSLRGRSVGVFVGMEESQYSLITDAPGVTTAGAAMISSRLSYFLDLRGPVLATNTACSSGLVALHQAVSSLQQGECETALVGSVALSLSPKAWEKMSQAGMLSPDGLCRAFSKQADGIGIGEAAVALVLAPLQTALDRGLPVYGVIRGSGTNFDGRTNGVTAPNGQAQEQLIESVYRRHGIDVRDVGHVITHGTGTRIGDPVELNALHNAFETLGREAGHDRAALPCAVTSVKSNLGHTMAASGLVSVIALVQGLTHGLIPPSLHCEEENDYIAWRDSRLYINKSIREWTAPEGRARLGAVSAFGRSGTNAHVVIEAFRDPRPAAAAVVAEQILPLSARTPEQLRQQAENLLTYLERGHIERSSKIDLAALADTLQSGRDAMTQRLVVIADSTVQLCAELRGWLAGEPSQRVMSGRVGNHVVLPAVDADALVSMDRNTRLSKTASAWTQGAKVDWSALGDEASATRLHLPTYPFAQDRYWAVSSPTSKAAHPAELARGSMSHATRSIETHSINVPSIKSSSAKMPSSERLSIEDILDRVDAGTLAGGEAAAIVRSIA